MFNHWQKITLLLLLFTLASTSIVAAQTDAVLRLVASEESTGETTIEIQLAEINDVFALELAIDFDPALLEVVDNTVVSGNCPTADFELANDVDATTGTISYAVTQLQSEPCNGGQVATFNVQCVGEATPATLTFGTHLIADRNGLPLDHSVEETTINCVPTAVTLRDVSSGNTPFSSQLILILLGVAFLAIGVLWLVRRIKRSPHTIPNS